MRCVIRTVLVLTALCFVAQHIHAQTESRSTDTVKKKQYITTVKPKGPKQISHEVSGGIRLNSDGWSVYMDLGRIKAQDLRHSDMFYNVRLWQLEVTEKKNPKEYKSSGRSGSNTYIYGKINNFYALKLGRCYMHMLAGKPDPGNVSIHWLYGGGFSLGMLKPYYLRIGSDPNAIKYNDDTKMNFLDQSVIEGSAGFSKGLSDIKMIPGFHAKTAVHFDFSANRKNVIGVETGINAEYYTQEVQIMANQSSTPYFVDVYLAFQFGKRW
jgi:hypothetical protein